MATLAVEFQGKRAKVQAGLLRRELKKLGLQGKVVSGNFRNLQRKTNRMSGSFAQRRQGVLRYAAGYLALDRAMNVIVGKTEFEAKMTQINTLVGVSADQVDAWRGQIRRMAGDVGAASGALAGAQFVITSAGEKTDESLRILAQSGKATAIGLGDTASVARTVTAAMTAYKDENLSAAEATDILVATVREGNLEAADLSGSLGRVLGIAAQLDVSFAGVGGFVATFTRLGVDSEEATTALRGLLSQLQKGRGTFEALGLDIDQVRQSIAQRGLAQTLIELVQLFEGNEDALATLIPNVRALSGVLGTAAAQGQDFAQIEKSIADSAGVLNEAFDKVKETPEFAFKQLASAGEELGFVFADQTVPAVHSLSEALTSLAQNDVVQGAVRGVGKLLGDAVSLVTGQVFVDMQDQALAAIRTFGELRDTTVQLREEIEKESRSIGRGFLLDGEQPRSLINQSTVDRARAGLKALREDYADLRQQLQAIPEFEGDGVMGADDLRADQRRKALQEEIGAQKARIDLLDTLIEKTEELGVFDDVAAEKGQLRRDLVAKHKTALQERLHVLKVEAVALAKGAEEHDLFNRAMAAGIPATQELTGEMRKFLETIRDQEEANAAAVSRQELLQRLEEQKAALEEQVDALVQGGESWLEFAARAEGGISKLQLLDPAIRRATLELQNQRAELEHHKEFFDFLDGNISDRLGEIEVAVPDLPIIELPIPDAPKAARFTDDLKDAFEDLGDTIEKELGQAFKVVLSGAKDTAGAVRSILSVVGQVGGQVAAKRVGTTGGSFAKGAGFALSQLGQSTSSGLGGQIGSAIGAGIGGAVGGPVGAAIGAAIGEVLGGVIEEQFFSASRPFFSINVALREGTLAVGEIRRHKHDGQKIRNVGEGLVDQIGDAFKALGGTLEGLAEAANLSVFSQAGKVEVRFRGRTFRKFGENVQAALDFFVLEVVRRADVKGLSGEVLAAIRQAAGEAKGNLDAFSADLGLIQEISRLNDIAGLTPGARQAVATVGQFFDDFEHLMESVGRFDLSGAGVLSQLSVQLEEQEGNFLSRSRALARRPEDLKQSLNDITTQFSKLRDEVEAHNAELQAQIVARQAELEGVRAEIELTKARIQAQKAVLDSTNEFVTGLGHLAQSLDPDIGGIFLRSLQDLPQIDFTGQLASLERTAANLEEVIDLLNEAQVPLGQLAQDRRAAVEGVRDTFLGQIQDFLGQNDPAAAFLRTQESVDTFLDGLDVLQERGLVTTATFLDLARSLEEAGEAARRDNILDFSGRAADFLGDNDFISSIRRDRATATALIEEFDRLIEAGVLTKEAFAGVRDRLLEARDAAGQGEVLDFSRRAASFLGDRTGLIASIEDAKDTARSLVDELDALAAAGEITDGAFAGVRDRILAAGDAAAGAQIQGSADGLLLSLLERLGREEEAGQLRFQLVQTELQFKRAELDIAIERFNLEGQALARVRDTISQIDAVLPEITPDLFAPRSGPRAAGGGVGGGSISQTLSSRNDQLWDRAKGLLDQLADLGRTEGPAGELERMNASFDEMRATARDMPWHFQRFGRTFQSVMEEIDQRQKEQRAEFFRDLFKPVRDFRAELDVGDFSLLRGRERTELARDRFREVVDAVLAGDLNRVGEVRGLGEEFLALLRQSDPRGTVAFREGRAEVEAALEQLAALGRLGEEGQLNLENQERLIEQTRLMRERQERQMAELIQMNEGANYLLEQIHQELQRRPLGGVA